MTATGNLAGVAIVDDEPGMIRSYELLFRRRNIPVAFFALTGEEAVDRFRATNPRPRVAIVDYRLPGMDGLAVMREIRSIEPGTHIIMISGDTTVGQTCLDCGAAAFFKKPASISEITETVNRLLNV